MTKHVVPHTKCNLGCTYCYEEPGRDYSQSEIDDNYNFEKVMERVEGWLDEEPAVPIGMHGGEPLLMRDEHLEEIFQYVHENSDSGRSHIQTNGTLISDEHLRMFEEYNVSIGISCDGPADLNSEREARSGNDDITQNMTQATLDAIDRVVEEGFSPGIIVVLHEVNAGTDERLERLLGWMDDLNKRGVTGHFNPAIPYENVQEDISLSPERLRDVYLRTWEWMLEEEYRTWNPFRQMQDNLLGLRLSACTNKKCDVFNTEAAQSITGKGNTTGCGKTWEAVGDGTTFLQGESAGNEYGETEERYDMLKEIPGPHTEEVKNGEMEDQGGCKGCKFWNVCHGGCPSDGMDDDYRNRTRICEAKYDTYERIESSMRAMFPGVDLITDLPWDAELGEPAQKGKLGLKPFAGISPEVSSEPRVTGGSHNEGAPGRRVGKHVLDFPELVEQYKEEYPPEILTIEPERESIHADSVNN